MNAVEIEAAVSDLATQPFDAAEFPFAFLAAFDNNETTITRLRKGNSNKSDIPGAVLQQNNIHIATCEQGQVGQTLSALKASPKTKAAKAKFILATDGNDLEAEDLNSDETIACEYPDFAQHFGFFLPLAGISTVKEIKDNPIDIKATGRLNKLYVELLRENPTWATEARRHDMNHFLARLIFCFFAEDTDIFMGSGLFTNTIQQMSESDGSNVHFVLSEVFRAMDVKPTQKSVANLPNWAEAFPYVNGNLFSGSTETPKFTKIARTYLIRAGELNWRHINPDIFGSMIQAVADDEERGALGMHYTSVPNILKVLNPLFLDDLRAKLDLAENRPKHLAQLRERISRIRVFDPACGSGNFLVIAYKELRALEAEINNRLGDPGRPTLMPTTNFCGIELRDFAAEIARLAMIIAQYQSDVKYLGPLEAKEALLPLKKENWIVQGNALRLDWTSICPATGTGVEIKTTGDNLLSTPRAQTKIDFQNEGGETYICGNPPYKGSTWQTDEQKNDLELVFGSRCKAWKSLDYVAGWFMKAADYGERTKSVAAFVSTNSICQGQQVPILWPLILRAGHEIAFAHLSFKWQNLAAHNAGVTVVIVGISNRAGKRRPLYEVTENSATVVRWVDNINPYLVPAPDVIVNPTSSPGELKSLMEWGNKPTDGGHLFLSSDERQRLLAACDHSCRRFIRKFVGAQELIRGEERYCLWIEDSERKVAERCEEIRRRIAAVAVFRSASKAAETRPAAMFPHRFRQIQSTARAHSIAVPGVSSENREFLPCDLLTEKAIVGNKCFALYDAPLWNMALIASRLHWVWIGTVCVRLRTDFSYSNTLGWNTFPVPTLTEQNKADLTRCAEDILLAREAHFPARIADLYDPDNMPEELRRAHDRNDEVLERIYIGRRFKNDTERLEKLFDLYTKMTANKLSEPKTKRGKKVTAQTETLI